MKQKEQKIVLDLVPAHSMLEEIQKEYGAITAYEITDESGCTFAIEACAAIKARAKALDESRKLITKPLDDAKKMVMDLFRGPAEQLDRAERVIKHALMAFQQAAEARRLEAQRAADEAARIETEKRQQELAAAAEKDLEEGRTIAALDKIERAENVYVVPDVVPSMPKVAGMTTRSNWKHRVVEPNAVPRHFCCPDDKLLAALAKSQKGSAKVEGVEFYEDKSVAIGGR